MPPADVPGLQYRRARYYDPLVGQFTQLDRIGMRGGRNLYGYANGDPVNFRDPSGLSPDGPPCELGESIYSCLAQFGDLGPVEGLWHYLFGDGAPLNVDIAGVNLPQLTPRDFQQIVDQLQARQPGSFAIDASRPVTVRGAQHYLYGDVTVRLTGTLDVTCRHSSCSWWFSGTYTIAPDLYDFNRSTHRNNTGESLTSLGRQLPGTPYTINFHGAITTYGSGGFPIRPGGGP